MKRIELETKANEIAKLYYKNDDCERLELRDRIMEVVDLALTIPVVVGQSEQLKCPNCELDYDKEEIEMFRGLCESCRDRAF